MDCHHLGRTVHRLNYPLQKATHNQRFHANGVCLARSTEVCPALEELTVSSNDLQNLEGLQGLQQLRRGIIGDRRKRPNKRNLKRSKEKLLFSSD